jgi:hypothetical protein
MIKNSKTKSPVSKGERDLINMTVGKKKPKNARDEKLTREINEIKKKGGQIYIPHD